MSAKRKTVGVIGGMGPGATIDFLRRIVAATPAHDDADHIHVLVDNNPQIPSRIAALIEGHGEDPAPVLCAMARGLEKQGADFLVMPCNTAHYYLPQIARAVNIPVLDMIALSVAQIAALLPERGRVGMLASPAVQRIGLYETRLREAGLEALFPDALGEEKLLSVIRAVKSGGISQNHHREYAEVADSISAADVMLIACTELSVLGPPKGISRPFVDALDVLVNATIEEARG
jgi:aspartate racemase